MIKHWIDGREVESKDVFVNYNPATGEAIGEVASGGVEEVAQAVAAAKAAFPKWANTPAKERARLMRELGELIEQNVPKHHHTSLEEAADQSWGPLRPRSGVGTTPASSTELRRTEGAEQRLRRYR